MKVSIGSIWFVGLVFIFLFIFSAYIIITVDYSSTFKLKNEVLNIIEKNKGITADSGFEINSIIDSSKKVKTGVGSLRTINLFLSASTYTAKGHCPVVGPGNTVIWYGVKELDPEIDSTDVKPVDDDEVYYYCVTKFKSYLGKRQLYKPAIYKVQLFYKFEIPILREFLPIRVEGTTSVIYNSHDTVSFPEYELLPLD